MEAKKIRVLLLEDDPRVVCQIRDMLAIGNNAKYDLESCERISSGLNRIPEGDIDVILLDLSMRNGKSLSSFYKVYEQTPGIPIIILSNLEKEKLALRALEEGADDYFIKDCMDSDSLLRAINLVIQRKKAQEILRTKSHHIVKRIRELNCLYAIFDVLEGQDATDEDVLRVIVDLIPTAWQYPLSACTRIILEGSEVRTHNFRDTKWKQTSEIVVMGEQIGSIEVCYLEEKPESDEGPFRLEERSLITVISNQLGNAIERKKAEEALQESESKYRNLVERANDGILIIQEGSIKYANPRLLEMAGCTGKEIIDTPFINFVHPDEISKVVDRYMRRMVGEQVEGLYETILKRMDGSDVHAEVNAGLITYLGEPADLVFVRDITDRKLSDMKLKETMKELEKSNRELENFAYVASHDLQEPLRTISTYLQLLEFRYKDKLDEDANEFISYVVDSAHRMRELIDDLLTYSRIGTHKKQFKPIDCTAAFALALGNLQSVITESGATITHDSLPNVMADDVQISQLYQNLIGNAIKFHSEEPPRIHVSAKQSDNEWVFSVNDNGIGIESEYVDNIFTIFKRLHSTRKYPGTGIGLALSKKIVEGHGGRIWVESEPGMGSTFFFTIPKSGREHL